MSYEKGGSFQPRPPIATPAYVIDKKRSWWKGLSVMLLLSWLPIAVLFYEAGLRQLTLSQILSWWYIREVQGPVVLAIFIGFMMLVPKFMNRLALPEESKKKNFNPRKGLMGEYAKK